MAGGGNAAIDLSIAAATGADGRCSASARSTTTWASPTPCWSPRASPIARSCYRRVARRGPGQMPPLATAVVDEAAVALIRDWIAALDDAGSD